MSETRHPLALKKYRVKVGLAECTVSSCASEEEAVRKARSQLNREMPQMSSIIRGILDKEFRVDQVG